MTNPVHYVSSHPNDTNIPDAIQPLCELHILKFLKLGRTVKLLDMDIPEKCSVCLDMLKAKPLCENLPAVQIMRTMRFVKKGATALTPDHPKGTELGITRSGTWRLRQERDRPAYDYRIAEPIDEKGYLTVALPSGSIPFRR